MHEENNNQASSLNRQSESVHKPSVHHNVHHRASHDSKPKKTSGDEVNMKKVLVGAAVLQVVLLIFISFQLSSLGDLSGAAVGAAIREPTAAAPSPSPAAPSVDMKTLIDDDSIKGDKDAPVTIVEFSDYECPFCARFYSDTYGQIVEKYIDTGKVNLVYRDFPLSFHPNAQKAGEAAECAGEQGKYYEMHDLLFEKGVSGGVSAYKQYAKEIGLKTSDFDSCLDSGEMAGEVRKDFTDGQRAGVQGTPAFFIDGKLISGAQPFPAFEAAIEAALN
jgi:protein-disulfide isomerase